MSIEINQDKCISCRKCLLVCPGNLIKLNQDKKAWIKYPKDCWGCTSCLKECSSQAISFYLGADIGGMGSKLTVDMDENFVYWQIKKSNVDVFVTSINRKDSNKY